MDQLFTLWMRKACVQLDEARLEKFWKAALGIAAMSPANMQALVLFFFGLKTQDEINPLIEALRKSDPLLATTSDQAKELAYLVGGAVVAAQEKKEMDAAALLAASLICGSLYGARSGDFPHEIIEYTGQKLQDIRTSQLQYAVGALNDAALDKRLEDLTELLTPNINNAEFAKKLMLAFRSHRGDAHGRLRILANDLKRQAEESEYLWRTITMYSDIGEARYKELPAASRPILLGLDLSIAGPSPIPGPAAEPLLRHNLVASNEVARAEKSTIQEYVDGVPLEVRQRICSRFVSGRVSQVYPILHAIHTSVEIGKDGAWGSLYERRGGPKVGTVLAPERLALQILTEAKLYLHCNKPIEDLP